MLSSKLKQNGNLRKKNCFSFQQKTPMGTCSNITCYLNVYTNHDQHVVCQLAAFLNKIYNCYAEFLEYVVITQHIR